MRNLTRLILSLFIWGHFGGLATALESELESERGRVEYESKRKSREGSWLITPQVSSGPKLGISGGLNISYMKNFDENSKDKIIEEIEKDFEHALKGIAKLPKKARFGVYIAYRYYNKLLKKLKNTSSRDIKESRVRIDNFQKFVVLTRSYVKYQLNLILWI